MREISRLEQKVALHIYNLDHISLESIIKCEFNNTPILIDGHHVSLYYKIEKGVINDIARNNAHTKALEVIDFCDACVSLLQLLEQSGMLLKSRAYLYSRNGELGSNSQTSFFYDTGVDKLDNNYNNVKHFINSESLPVRLKELDGCFFKKTNNFNSYIKNKFITTTDKREQDNLKIAKWALIVSAISGLASLGLEIYDKFLK